jgi:RNA polymerase sigma-70 factor, ECF subfamily
MPFRIKSKQALTDQGLLDAFINSGNLEWLGILYQRYMHLVYGVCLKYYKDRDLAQDGVMEIFEKLAKDLPNHQIREFKPWLYVITKNHCLMALRHMKSIQAHEGLLKIETALFMENSFDWHPFEKDGQDDLEERLKACLEKLKLQQKACIEQFYLEKKCYQEIGQSLNLDLKNVKSYIQNGKRNLKNCLEGVYEEA